MSDALPRIADRIATEVMVAPTPLCERLAKDWPDLVLLLADLLDEMHTEVPLSWLEVRHR
ncbi:MAG: hypothetical protein J2P27_01155 [Actinobacteria bacterium]|nr:hypothetical protein [Actinomycetota bacterium]